MNKYVVAFYSNFDGSMLMDEVYAKSSVEAGKIFLLSEDPAHDEFLPEVTTLEQLRSYVFDQDHAIGVYQVSNLPRSGRSGGENIVENRIH